MRGRWRTITRVASGSLLLLAVTCSPRAAVGSFVNFESGQVRPLALSPDGALLFAVNTPDNRLALFRVTESGLAAVVEVRVGLEPVAVAVRSTGAGALQAWVVNHLSDSVSIVGVDPDDPESATVEGTLLVGDEPRDVVFAGSAANRAFITTARRGQNLPAGLDPALTTEGTPRALVWAFDADDPFADTGRDADSAPSPLGGEPLAVIELFGDSPRALAVSPDGSRVYAAIFLSGNQTTVIREPNVDVAGVPPPPADSPFYPDQVPTTPLIVRRDPDSGLWLDELARSWGSFLRLSLPDQDVFTIDAGATPPTALQSISGVGTVLYGMAVRPTDGALYIANTEAFNEIRFEPLIDATRGLQGRFVDNRITIIDSPATLPGPSRPVGLNPHADRTVPTGPPEEAAESLALPSAMAFSADGQRLYVAGPGTDAVGIFDADALAVGTVQRALVPVGGGPCGLVLDQAGTRLYVLNRFDQTISVIAAADDPDAAHSIARVNLGFDPTPSSVNRGRRFLFASQLSGHGDVSCASCHVFGDFDGLGWDLGNPYGTIEANPNGPGLTPFHPMKGPMTTQSLRGMDGAGPMHWRGDRTAAATGGDPFDSDGAFKAFNPAFVGLLGSPRMLTDAELQLYTDWAMSVRYPPNPVARLDGVATPDEADGLAQFLAEDCDFCHAFPLGTSRGSVVLTPGAESLKVPHLRNVYAKVGMFGQQAEGFQNYPYLGDQTRGFGFFHDGSDAILELALVTFGTPHQQHIVPVLSAYVLAFPTGLAPVVGQQLSATPDSAGDAATLARRDLLIARAQAGDCDLVVYGRAGGAGFGARYVGGGMLETDRAAAPNLSVAALWNAATSPGAEQVWSCVPPGTGNRMALDRDADGYRDGDEFDAGSNPADPVSVPGLQSATMSTARLKMRDGTSRRFRFVSGNDAAIVPPAPGSAGDPTVAGATLRIYNGAGSGEQATIELPAHGWTARSNGFAYRVSEGGVRSVRIKPGRLQISGGGDAFAYTLDEPAQQRMVVRLVLGTGVDLCAEAAAASATRDVAGRFQGHLDRAPLACPPPPSD